MDFNRWFIFIFVSAWLIGGVVTLSLPASGGFQTVEAAPAMATQTVLHFQGNTEEGCTGNGLTDFTACNGPFLKTDSALSTNTAASWSAAAGVNSNADRSANSTDPNWIWNLTGATRIGGPMTVEWWGQGAGVAQGVSNADWYIRVWADGEKKFEQRVTATPLLAGAPSLLSVTVSLPAITASNKIVLHIDPFYSASQQGTRIWYDSQSPCPGATGNQPCDSKVTLFVLTPNEPVPTPTPAPNNTPPPSACAVPTFDNYQPPVTLNGTPYPRRNDSAEPSVGINWNTGNVMAMSRLRANRSTFNDSTSPADPNTVQWFSQTSPAIRTGLDPILFTDPVTGRTIAGELQGAGGATNGFISDDDLTTVSATFQTGGATQGVDHQTIGGGPPNPNIPDRQPSGNYPHLFYYASQQIAYASVATSFDGGQTYQPAVPAYNLTQCSGLHGHIKVAPDGTVYLPNKNCGGRNGFAVSEDNGLTWDIRVVPDSTAGRTDPSIGIGAGGRIYYAYTGSNNHPYVAVSDDRGATWSPSLNLGLAVSPSFKAAVFPAAVAGDNNRAAVFFLGTDSPNTNNADPTGTDGAPATGADPDLTNNFKGTWYPYIATTCDGGKSWSVVKADNDPLRPGLRNPVQQGVICTNGTSCPEGPPDTRNLLDFNDMAVDSRGRIVAVYADGCISETCVNLPDHSAAKENNDGTATLTLIRQRGGMRLFAAFDPGGPVPPPLPPPVSVEETGMGNKIKWATPDEGGSPLTAYRIYRARAGSKGEAMIAEVKPDVLSYVDRKTRRIKGVSYRVAAVNKYGETRRPASAIADSRSE